MRILRALNFAFQIFVITVYATAAPFCSLYDYMRHEWIDDIKDVWGY